MGHHNVDLIQLTAKVKSQNATISHLEEENAKQKIEINGLGERSRRCDAHKAQKRKRLGTSILRLRPRKYR
jgi:hypothetical protein